jgi:hypothetical protein
MRSMLSFRLHDGCGKSCFAITVTRKCKRMRATSFDLWTCGESLVHVAQLILVSFAGARQCFDLNVTACLRVRELLG